MNNEQRKQAIENTVNTARTAMSELRKLKDECPHNVVGDPEGSARCDICEQFFGWYCEESLDKTCHYFTEDGKIEFSDGTRLDANKTPGVEWQGDQHETYDCCLFCGNPDERK